MKKLNYLLSTIVLLAVLITVGCGGDGDDGPTAEEVVLEKLSKSWKLSSATFDGGSITDMNGLVLTIDSNLGYNTNSGTLTRQPNPFPSSGTWIFTTKITDKDQSIFTITRDDGLDIDVTLTETDLNLSFGFTEGTHKDSSSRDEAVDGDWSIKFSL